MIETFAIGDPVGDRFVYGDSWLFISRMKERSHS